jgi:hypothetical protein
MDLVLALVTIVVSLVAGIGSGAVAARITANTTARLEEKRLNMDLVKWREQLRREDEQRFLDMKRERYARFLQLTGAAMTQLEANRAAADARSKRQAVDVPPLPQLTEIGELTEEIRLLTSGLAAYGAEMTFQELAYCRDHFGHPVSASLIGTGTAQTLSERRKAHGGYDEQRKYFLDQARDELAGRS